MFSGRCWLPMARLNIPEKLLMKNGSKHTPIAEGRKRMMLSLGRSKRT